MNLNFFKKADPEWILRIGLGVTFLYSGKSLLTKPFGWYGFLPGWFSQFIAAFMPLDTYLRIQGGLEIIVGVFFLAWFLRNWALKIALTYTILELTAVLIFYGIDIISFRDMGLLGAAAALMTVQMQKKIDPVRNL